jgi:multiple sugar transport system substrate-binding protein
MQNRYKAVLVLGLTVSLTTLAACGGGGGGPAAGGGGEEPTQFTKNAFREMTAWGFNNADDVGKARLDYAKSQLSGVNITLDQTGFDAQKFTTRAVSGDIPDVVQMDRSFVGTYAAQELILPLDTCYSAWGIDPKQHFYPAVVQDVTYKDQVWAAPQFFQPAAVIVNTRVLKSAGAMASEVDTSKNEQLIAFAKKVYEESGGNPSRLGFDPVPTGQPYLWLAGFGGRTMDDQGVPALDDPNNAKALAFLKQLVDAQGGWAKVKSFTDSFDVFGKQNQYVKDQVGAQINAQWYVNVLSPFVDDVEISAVPFKDQTGQITAVSSGTAFVIPAKAKNRDAACAWMTAITSEASWMAAEEARVATLKKNPGSINTGLFTGSPGADNAIRTQHVKNSGNQGFDETIMTYYEVLPHGKSLGASPAGQAIDTELKNAITSTLLGQKTPEQALADAQTAAKRAYDQVAG